MKRFEPILRYGEGSTDLPTTTARAVIKCPFSEIGYHCITWSNGRLHFECETPVAVHAALRDIQDAPCVGCSGFLRIWIDITQTGVPDEFIPGSFRRIARAAHEWQNTRRLYRDDQRSDPLLDGMRSRLDERVEQLVRETLKSCTYPYATIDVDIFGSFARMRIDSTAAAVFEIPRHWFSRVYRRDLAIALYRDQRLFVADVLKTTRRGHLICVVGRCGIHPLVAYRGIVDPDTHRLCKWLGVYEGRRLK